jgi:hypothetical protein
MNASAASCSLEFSAQCTNEGEVSNHLKQQCEDIPHKTLIVPEKNLIQVTFKRTLLVAHICLHSSICFLLVE